ncbi:progestin and adipoQ receptor family member 3 [Platysternon megacephalum]|uniref:Progestin and adipoQ receptor family member 3 n=1 Tax=Platysternon megacephalum TaxID=55544 RepID=A0A4D9E1J9_9SAUR|nr:progestin and adipoQ receptor family member 3 [Platysternon megacephalum]
MLPPPSTKLSPAAISHRPAPPLFAQMLSHSSPSRVPHAFQTLPTIPPYFPQNPQKGSLLPSTHVKPLPLPLTYQISTASFMPPQTHVEAAPRPAPLGQFLTHSSSPLCHHGSPLPTCYPMAVQYTHTSCMPSM